MTIVPQAAITIGRNDQFATDWCVYEHWMFNDATARDELIYVGLCKLTELFDMPDAWRNSHWRNVTKPTTVITVKLIMTGNRTDCTNERGKYLFTLNPRPVCNAIGWDTIGMSRRIVCNETNQVFSNQTEAARALGIPQGNLSAHLSGKRGVRTVKGLTFRLAKDNE